MKAKRNVKQFQITNFKCKVKSLKQMKFKERTVFTNKQVVKVFRTEYQDGD